MTEETMINSESTDVQQAEEGHRPESWRSSATDPGDRPVSRPADHARDGQASGEPVSPWQRLFPTLPAGLASNGPGAALWARVAAAPLLLTITETTLLDLACRELDLAEDCAAVVADEGVTLPWGDSTRAHPLLSKIAEHRGLAARLLRTLGMPDREDEDKPAQPRGVYAIYRERRSS